jgi:hypothetical protein
MKDIGFSIWMMICLMLLGNELFAQSDFRYAKIKVRKKRGELLPRHLRLLATDGASVFLRLREFSAEGGWHWEIFSDPGGTIHLLSPGQRPALSASLGQERLEGYGQMYELEKGRRFKLHYGRDTLWVQALPQDSLLSHLWEYRLFRRYQLGTAQEATQGVSEVETELMRISYAPSREPVLRISYETDPGDVPDLLCLVVVLIVFQAHWGP